MQRVLIVAAAIHGRLIALSNEKGFRDVDLIPSPLNLEFISTRSVYRGVYVKRLPEGSLSDCQILPRKLESAELTRWPYRSWEARPSNFRCSTGHRGYRWPRTAGTIRHTRV